MSNVGLKMYGLRRWLIQYFVESEALKIDVGFEIMLLTIGHYKSFYLPNSVG